MISISCSNDGFEFLSSPGQLINDSWRIEIYVIAGSQLG